MRYFLATITFLLVLQSCSKKIEDTKTHQLQFAEIPVVGQLLGKTFNFSDSKIQRKTTSVSLIDPADNVYAFEINLYQESINCLGTPDLGHFNVIIPSDEEGIYFLSTTNGMTANFKTDKGIQYGINQGFVEILEKRNDTIECLIDLYYNKHNHINGTFTSYYCDQTALCAHNGNTVYYGFNLNNTNYVDDNVFNAPLIIDGGFLSGLQLTLQDTSKCGLDSDSSYITLSLNSELALQTYCFDQISEPKLHLNYGLLDSMIPFDTSFYVDTTILNIDSIFLADTLSRIDTILLQDSILKDSTYLVLHQFPQHAEFAIDSGGVKITEITDTTITGKYFFSVNEQNLGGIFKANRCD